MDRKRHEEVLSHIDKALGDLPPVTCWRCGKGKGAPSTCVACLAELKAEEVKVPKGHKWVPWVEDSENPVMPKG